MIMKRVLHLLRQHWPHTHIVLRGDGHFANPELMELVVADGNADFISGLGGNAVLSRKAEGLMRNARGHLELHLPTACPVKALLATVCGRLYPHNSRMRSMLASP